MEDPEVEPFEPLVLVLKRSADPATKSDQIHFSHDCNPKSLLETIIRISASCRFDTMDPDKSTVHELRHFLDWVQEP